MIILWVETERVLIGTQYSTQESGPPNTMDRLYPSSATCLLGDLGKTLDLSALQCPHT